MNYVDSGYLRPSRQPVVATLYTQIVLPPAQRKGIGALFVGPTPGWSLPS